MRAGRIVGVHCQYDGSFDEISTDFVINAAGAWSRALLLTAGLDVPDIRLFQSSLLVVEPPLAECMLLSLDKLGMTVVPHLHRTVFGVNGDAQPLEVPEDELQTGQASIDTLTHAVVDLMPMTSGHKNFAAWVWTCRKTEFVQAMNGHGRSPAYAVLDHSAQGIANLLTCLPGKFTAAPAMATAVLTQLRERLPLTRMGLQAMASGIR